MAYKFRVLTSAPISKPKKSTRYVCALRGWESRGPCGGPLSLGVFLMVLQSLVLPPASGGLIALHERVIYMPTLYIHTYSTIERDISSVVYT